MTGYFDDLPDSRTSLKGTTADGDEAWLIRSISQKLYRCPNCGGSISIGDEHVVVQYVRRGGGTEHQHWHRRCMEERLIHEIRGIREVSAQESQRGKLEQRGRQKPGRRRRDLRR